MLFMVDGFASSHGDISGKAAFGRWRARVKSTASVPVVHSPGPPPRRSTKSFGLSSSSPSARLSIGPSVGGKGVGTPNAFRPRGADYIDRFMIAALLQGLGRITGGGRVKRRCLPLVLAPPRHCLVSFSLSTAGCRYISQPRRGEYLASASPGGDIQGAA